jgi:hypothetical protein
VNAYAVADLWKFASVTALEACRAMVATGGGGLDGYADGGPHRQPSYGPLKPIQRCSEAWPSLAHRADVHQTYLSGVEGGKRNPSIGVLGRITKALGVDIEESPWRPRRREDGPGLAPL